MTGQLVPADRASWTHPACGERLPVGALTCIDAATAETGDCWWTLVGHLIAATLERQQPVVYVTCGGEFYVGGRVLADRKPTPLLAIHDDEDLIVFGPATEAVEPGKPWSHRRTVTGRQYYHCHLPTLYRLRPVVAAHEVRFGVALVVLDAVNCARPYSEAVPGAAAVGPVVPFELSHDQVAGWLARDLLDFAESRPNAPTVVVFELPAPLDPTPQLTAVSRAFLCGRSSDTDPNLIKLRYSARSALTCGWPATPNSTFRAGICERLGRRPGPAGWLQLRPKGGLR